MKLPLCCVVFAVAAAACGGGNKVTGPVPCDTYTGGIIGTGALPGTYDLKSVCSGMKPDQPGASGTVIITQTAFTAAIGRPQESGGAPASQLARYARVSALGKCRFASGIRCFFAMRLKHISRSAFSKLSGCVTGVSFPVATSNHSSIPQK